MYRFEWYQRLWERRFEILSEARRVGEELVGDLKGRVGLYPGSSSCPGPLPRYVLEAMEEANRVPVLPMRRVEDELRCVVKDLFGDEYDAAATNTCEAALRVVFEVLFAPPTMRRGDAYRARFIAPYGEDYEFMAGYGRPYPPRYKGLYADRSCTGGELAVEGKSLHNLDAVFVRLAGARYECHGIKYSVVPLLTDVEAEGSIERMRRTAERHAPYLVGIESIGYDTPGYGYGEKDPDGVPRLKRLMGRLAEEYDIPYVIDCASGVPSFGYHPRDVGAHVMMWSMDKVVRAPTSGLIVGHEEVMNPIRKSLGLGGERYGEVSSHSKALFSLCDPGRDAVVGMTAVLKVLRDEPEKVRRPIDEMHRVIEEEFRLLEPDWLREGLIITKSYTMGGTEVNYEKTWSDGRWGLPIFSAEDLFAGTNLIMEATAMMGVHPATIYSGNIFLAPGLGTLDEEGNFIEENARTAVKALVKAIEIVYKHCPRAGE